MDGLCVVYLCFTRLHSELRESLERQLHGLPAGLGLDGDSQTEDGLVKNLQEQIQLSLQV